MTPPRNPYHEHQTGPKAQYLEMSIEMKSGGACEMIMTMSERESATISMFVGVRRAAVLK